MNWQCSILEGQKDYYGDIIQKSKAVKKISGVKQIRYAWYNNSTKKVSNLLDKVKFLDI